MKMKYFEPAIATLATGAAGAMSWIKEADNILQLIVTVLTLAWWFRLWIKNPKIPPPQFPKIKPKKDEMKSLLFLPLALSLLAVGCRTLPPCAEDPNSIECKQAEADRVGRILESISYTGTALAVRNHPQRVEPFRLSSNKLLSLSTNSQIDMISIQKCLNDLPVDQLNGETATIILGNLPIVIEEFGVSGVNATNVIYLQPVARGLGRGIKRAIE